MALQDGKHLRSWWGIEGLLLAMTTFLYLYLSTLPPRRNPDAAYQQADQFHEQADERTEVRKLFSPLKQQLQDIGRALHAAWVHDQLGGRTGMGALPKSLNDVSDDEGSESQDTAHDMTPLSRTAREAGTRQMRAASEQLPLLESSTTAESCRITVNGTDSDAVASGHLRLHGELQGGQSGSRAGMNQYDNTLTSRKDHPDVGCGQSATGCSGGPRTPAALVVVCAGLILTIIKHPSAVSSLKVNNCIQ